MREVKTACITWSEEENKAQEAQEGDGWLNFAEFLKTKMRRYRCFQKLGALQRGASNDQPGYIYFASEDRKAIYMIRTWSHPKPVVDDLCRRSGWLFYEYSVWRMTLKEYGAELEPLE